MTAYYNEHDPKKAAWLRELIAAGVIAPGIVDERSIEDVLPSELVQYTQCHFFAGVGIWSYALRQAGWPDDRPAWTGSCPCQPFSAAGKRAGTSDERHLWPAFYWLIRQCQPDVVFGEQVASKDGIAWLDIVWADLEAANYAIGPLDLCAAGVGAPHIRQRLYFVAYASIKRHDGRRSGEASNGTGEPERSCNAGILGNAASERRREARTGSRRSAQRTSDAGELGQLGDAAEGGRQSIPDVSGSGRTQDEPPIQGSQSGIAKPVSQLGDADAAGSQGRELLRADRSGDSADQCAVGQAGPTSGFWGNAEWIYCRDGKWRPTQPGISPLVNGAAERLVRSGNPSAPLDADNTAEARTLRLRGYGDGIVAPLAVEFIRAAMEWNA